MCVLWLGQQERGMSKQLPVRSHAETVATGCEVLSTLLLLLWLLPLLSEGWPQLAML